MKPLLLLISLLTITSCSHPKYRMIDSFESMYEDLRQMKFEKISEYLDEDSRILFEKLTSKENYHVEKLAQIGEEYNLRFFCIMYYLRFGLDRPDVNQDDFFKFILNERVSFFKSNEVYQVDKRRSRIRNENWVSIYSLQRNSKQYNWVKYTLNEENEFKFDLIQSLQGHERMSAGVIENAIKRMKSDSDSDYDAYLKVFKYMATGERTNIHEEDFWKKISK